MKYQLFQIRDEAMREFGFRPFDKDRAVDPANYRQTYAGEIASHETDAARLEALFRLFNLEHPADFRSYSLSVGDVVLIDSRRAYYCDMVGWQPISAAPFALATTEG